MKKIKEPQYNHWIYGIAITCKQCNGEFQCETQSDFQEFGVAPEVEVRCPYCKRAQRVYKPKSRVVREEKWWNEADKIFNDMDKIFDDFPTKGWSSTRTITRTKVE